MAIEVVNASQYFRVLVCHRLLSSIHCVVVAVSVLRLRGLAYERLRDGSIGYLLDFRLIRS